MMNTATLARAALRVAEIRGRGIVNDPTLIDVSAITGGRETRPDYFYGHGTTYTRPEGEGGESGARCVEFWPGDEFRDAHRSAYVVDGVPMYVAGWQGQGNGTADPRPDGWIILRRCYPGMVQMPRRTYYLITTVHSEVHA